VFQRFSCLALPNQAGPAPLVKDVGPIDTLFKHVVPEFHGPFNLTGLPTLSVPCGFSENNLPIALQLVGKPFDEITVLRAGYTYQQHMKWYERRPPRIGNRHRGARHVGATCGRKSKTTRGDADNGDTRINPREWNCSAAVFGDLVFLSGTVADDKSLDMKGQTAQVLKKIDAVLEKAGTNKSRILSATVYMADASLKDEMNEAWMAWVDRSNLPTRTAVGAVLTPGTMVEITICAAK
jgi:enamine deaminase RidA (YjgF/YER057c/UK114 family)